MLIYITIKHLENLENYNRRDEDPGILKNKLLDITVFTRFYRFYSTRV